MKARGIVLRNSREFTNVVRIWFGCDNCGMYGSATVGKTWLPDRFVGHLNEAHNCHIAAKATP